MSTRQRLLPDRFWPGQAALPLKDAVRFVRNNLRQGTQAARSRHSGEASALPFFLARAADEVLSAGETMVRSLVVGDRGERLVRAFPYDPANYLGAASTAGLSPRELFVKTHYAVAKHLTRGDASVMFICETAINAAYDELLRDRATSAGDALALAAAITLHLLRQRPIRAGSFVEATPAHACDVNLAVFAAAGLATAAAGLDGAVYGEGTETLALAREVVSARREGLRAALASRDPQGELAKLFARLAPLLL